MMSKNEMKIRQSFPKLVLGRAYEWGGINDLDKEAMGRFSQEAPLELVVKLSEQINHNKSNKKGHDPYEVAQRYLLNPKAKEFEKYLSIGK